MKLELSPDQASYAASESNGFVRIETEGGPAILYGDLLDPSSLVTVNWICDPDEYETLVGFYKVDTKGGAIPFLIDLILDGPLHEEYEVQFVPGSVALTEQSGLTYVVSANLEVFSKEIDPEIDELIIQAYTGETNLGTLLSRLAQLVNFDFPESVA